MRMGSCGAALGQGAEVVHGRRPLEVVQEEHERLLVGKASKEMNERLRLALAHLLLVIAAQASSGGCGCAERGGDIGEDAAQLGGVLAGGARQPCGAGLAQIASDGFDVRLAGDGAFLLVMALQPEATTGAGVGP